MASKIIRLAVTLPASPAAVYDAWLDGKRHGAMTGAKATASAKVGGKFSAWDGYATGKNLALKMGKQIVQSWRTSDFGASDPDSKLEIRLEKAKTGTKLTLIHSGVPSGTEATYKDGWREYYFAPMKEYFGRHT